MLFWPTTYNRNGIKIDKEVEKNDLVDEECSWKAVTSRSRCLSDRVMKLRPEVGQIGGVELTDYTSSVE